jgi:hypothetical protein
MLSTGLVNAFSRREVASRLLSTCRRPVFVTSADWQTLARANPHKLDNNLEFDAEEHAYFYDGKRMKWSVTTMLQEYFHHFDGSAAVRLMMTGKNWPRKEYSHQNGTPFNEEEILQQWDQIGEYARVKGGMVGLLPVQRL